MNKRKVASAKIVALKKSNMIKADGSFPIYLRVRFDRKKYEYSLGFSVTEKEFNFTTNRYKKNNSSNIELNEIEARAKEICEELQDDFSDYSFKEKFFGGNATKETVSEYLGDIVQELSNQKRFSTSIVYKNCQSALDRYKKNLRFTDITPQFLKKWEVFLLTPKKVNKNTIKGCGTSTISIYNRTLKAAYNRAIDDKIVSIEHYPFSNKNGKGYGGKGAVIRNKGTKSKFALSKDVMMQIMNFPSKPNSRLRHSINYFMFSYFNRGMNFKDMAFLKWDNIKNGRLKYIRAKTERTNSTEKEIDIAITPTVQEILNQYSLIQSETRSPFVFPVLEENLEQNTIKYRMSRVMKRVNKDLRMITKELNVPRADEMVFMVARHSYANVLKDAGRPTTDIQASLGHGRVSTTENYLHTLSDVLDVNDQLLYN